MIETFQDGGALAIYPKNYLKLLIKICRKNNILVAFDEMQAGFRTGYSFGYKHYGVKPDLICCGKGMGGCRFVRSYKKNYGFASSGKYE